MTSAIDNVSTVSAIEALLACIVILVFEIDVLRRDNREQAEKLARNLNKCSDALAAMRKAVHDD